MIVEVRNAIYHACWRRPRLVRTGDPLPAPQVAMYKPMPLEERVAGLADIDRILHDLEALCDGPWLCGANPTTADAAAMPLFVFITFMLPRFFGWDVFAGRPKLAAWWAAIRQDPHAKRVRPTPPRTTSSTAVVHSRDRHAAAIKCFCVCCAIQIRHRARPRPRTMTGPVAWVHSSLRTSRRDPDRDGWAGSMHHLSTDFMCAASPRRVSPQRRGALAG